MNFFNKINFELKVLFMKRNVLKFSFVVVCMFLSFSCLDNDDEIYISYGVIKNVISPTNYEILTDKGNTLLVTKSYTGGEIIENDKRVLVNFEILSDKESNKNKYEVAVNGFYNLLSKPLVNESFILEDETVRRDSIGNDPFTYVNAWFGGGYINIDFETYFVKYSSTKHLINLIWDDTRADSDTLYLTLRHNAYGEIPPKDDMTLYRGAGICSFKLSNLLPQGVTSKPVKLMWTQYGYNYEDHKDCFDTGVFRTDNNANNVSMNGGGYSTQLNVK